MTENKRFRTAYVCGDTGIIDEQANPEWFVENIMNVNDLKKNFDLCIDKMNNLHEEKEQLRQTYSQLKQRHSLLHDVCIDAECERDSLKKDVKSLEKENEQLKKQIDNLEHTRDFCAECCERLEKENEQLKSEIKKVQGAYEQLWMHSYK